MNCNKTEERKAHTLAEGMTIACLVADTQSQITSFISHLSTLCH